MQKTKRREWVKTFAIIFLVILLILTFFSNTIMNRSLPEVAAQYVESGTINAKIRGTGTVSADETYDVTINQTRKIRSVMVKVGDTVSAGDTLFVLEAADSEELKTAQQELSDMELAYQKSLIEAGNTTATENRDVQKLRDAYNEALAVLRLYSNADPTQITMALKTAEAEYKAQQLVTQNANEEYQAAQTDKEYTEAQAKVTELGTAITTAETAIETLKEQLATAQGTSDQAYLDKLAKAYTVLREEYLKREELEQQIEDLESQTFMTTADGTDDGSEDEEGGNPSTGATLEELKKQLKDLNNDIKRDEIIYKDDYNLMLQYAGQDHHVAAAYAADTQLLMQAIRDQHGYIDSSEEVQNIEQKIKDQERELDNAQTELSYYQGKVDDFERRIERLEQNWKDEQAKESALNDEVTNLTAASTAAETLKTAQTALEDKVFETSLGDSASLDLQNSKKAIEAKKKQVEELTANADGQEVKANVSGKISAINVTAGNNAGADTALATITVADRGYTLRIPVTADQAKQVTVGDVATITNYYSDDITATLESVANDPQNPGQGKMLVFRLTGDGVEAGANLTLSIGQRSANYDCLIPNSALRNDSNGDFVLVVVAKSTPLGNRYVATRASVTVLAKDDTKAAVTGLASGDFVITTSSAPIEAGSQVRLVDNG
ncbi:MAG TPA: HlyD family efflux transporter periplasmic adaptor subunit [Candidatus Avoscillospira avicola]|uniref:HlyD family efflux transporter periplasmic adaptor subunit n=1 Tax=Candidatus Avoscillospira avicola TaxID=2840706 RepID=A0A9D1DHV2_9FIRM|nr:HlyD family efflux transporter periplasmic adaptor subunit [Candidatus Avoscillospira avicola]